MEFKEGSQFLRRVVDTMGDPIFVKDDQHRWVFLNDAFCRFMGHARQELLGKSDYDFFPKEEADVFWGRDDLVLSKGVPDENEESFTDSEGCEHIIVTKKTRFIDEEGRKFLVGVIRDITKRKHLEARLAMAKRLMSLGTLAGGAAHEINNPLSFVLGNLDYIGEALEDPEESEDAIREALDAAKEGAWRVKEIVQGLRTFSQGSSSHLTPIDVRESLRATVHLARNEIRHRAHLIEEYDEVPLVDANFQNLGQIFLNLLINATHALPTSDSLANKICVRTLTSAAGDAVVEIIDTGEGISDDVRPHIFDPFFTTKKIGEGTGLGLSVVHTLTEMMQGHVEVESEPGKGSIFRVILPASGSTSLKKPPK